MHSEFIWFPILLLVKKFKDKEVTESVEEDNKKDIEMTTEDAEKDVCESKIEEEKKNGQK